MSIGSRLHLYGYDRRMVLPHEIDLSRRSLLVSNPEKLLVAVVAVEDDAQLLSHNLFGSMAFPHIEQRAVLQIFCLYANREIHYARVEPYQLGLSRCGRYGRDLYCRYGIVEVEQERILQNLKSFVIACVS